LCKPPKWYIIKISFRRNFYAKVQIKAGGTRSRNGFSRKTVITSYGDVDIKVPRERNGGFEPQLAKKQQNILTGDIEGKIISMYAKGMTKSDIAFHI